MIKTKDGVTMIEGTRIDLMADVICIIKAMVSKGILDKRDIEFIVAESLADVKERFDSTGRFKDRSEKACAGAISALVDLFGKEQAAAMLRDVIGGN